jgi:hypothetical protein
MASNEAKNKLFKKLRDRNIFWSYDKNITLNKNSILDILRENKYRICNDFGVVKIGLFGSYARDDRLI